MCSTGTTSWPRASTRREATCSCRFSTSRSKPGLQRRAPWAWPAFSANVRGMAYGPADAIDLTGLKRALVIQLRHHGDVLLTSPVFTVLKNHVPGIEVDALVYAETRHMLDLHPAIAQVHVIDRRWKELGATTRLGHEWRLHSALRARRYDLVVHLSEHPRGAWLARLLGARYSVAPNFGRKARMWKKSFSHLYPLPPHARRHRVEINLDALRRLGIQPGDDERKLVLVPGEDAERKVQALLAGEGLASRGFIHFHPGSRWKFKCWPPERALALLDVLAKRADRAHRRARRAGAGDGRGDPQARGRRARRLFGKAHAEGARGACRAGEALHRRGLSTDAHRRGDADADGGAVRAERRAGVVALAGAPPHRGLGRAPLPSMRHGRMRRRQGERVPHPASRGSGAERDRFAARAMIRGILLALFVASGAKAYALQVSDDRGVVISLARPAERIVTLAPHLAGIVYAAGAGARLVAVSSFSRHPQEAERLPVVASAGRIDIERLIA